MDLQAFSAYKLAVCQNNNPLARRLLNALVAAEDALVKRCAQKLARGDADDLLQAGRIGVVRAIEKFDPAKGAWTQFAKRWIFVEMERGVVELRPQARVTGRRSKKMPRAVRRHAHRILSATGRAATAQELGISEADWEAWQKAPAVVREYCEQETAGDRRGPHSPAPDILAAAATHPNETILTPAFWRALAALSEIEARVFLAIVIHETPVNEVARSEGHEERWARSTYKRAIEKMRDAMAVQIT